MKKGAQQNRLRAYALGLGKCGRTAIALRDYDLDAAILLPPGCTIVVGYGRAFAQAASLNAFASHAHARQQIAHRTGTVLRKALVVFVCADAVSEAFDLDCALRILLQEGGEFFQRVTRPRFKVRPTCRKEYVAQRDHKAAIGFLRLQISKRALELLRVPLRGCCLFGALLRVAAGGICFQSLCLGTIIGPNRLLLARSRLQISRNMAQAKRRLCNLLQTTQMGTQRMRQMRGRPNSDKKAEFRAQSWLRPELQPVRSDRECERLT